MVMFHSYVSLPEGNKDIPTLPSSNFTNSHGFHDPFVDDQDQLSTVLCTLHLIRELHGI
jgi:hypothetical protein